MPEYRRWFTPGATFFFTVVTYGRRPLFESRTARELLGHAWRSVAVDHRFETIAFVLLHDHLHCLWGLPPGDADFSARWGEIKLRFTKRWIDVGGTEEDVTDSQGRRGRRGVWQPRFWEHQIRNERDLAIHLDYIHYNPVKHCYVGRPKDWPHSSFLRHVRLGQYDMDWGSEEPSALRGLEWE